jgi:hypothetical protein
MNEIVCTLPLRRTASASHRADGAPAARPAPLVGLAGSDLSPRFRWWRGVTGRRYMFSVFRLPPERCGSAPADATARLDHVPRYDQAVVLAVACEAEEERRVVYMGETGTLPDVVFGGEALHQALRQGADEIHIHVLTEDAAGRRAMLSDLQG